MQWFALTTFLKLLFILSPVAVEATRVCKVLPGDPGWPSESEWNTLNETVSGRLIQTVPIAAPCHPQSPHYNVVECQRIRQNWHVPEFQYAYSPFCSTTRFGQHSPLCCLVSLTPPL